VQIEHRNQTAQRIVTRDDKSGHTPHNHLTDNLAQAVIEAEHVLLKRVGHSLLRLIHAIPKNTYGQRLNVNLLVTDDKRLSLHSIPLMMKKPSEERRPEREGIPRRVS